MSIEHDLCKVFCDGVSVTSVGAGLAVSTAFEDNIGDRISFYIVQDKQTGLYRIEDDGSLVSELVAMGTKVTEGQRGRVFSTILGRARVIYDDASGELRSALVEEDELPMMALQFVSMLIRVGALSAMNPEIVRNTFRDDAMSRIVGELEGRVNILQDQPLSGDLAESVPDLLLIAPSAAPVAVFIAVSDARIYEALLLRMTIDLRLAAAEAAQELCSVVALIDREHSRLVTSKMRQRAHNKLDAAPVFYGAEADAVARIAKEIPDIQLRLQ